MRIFFEGFIDQFLEFVRRVGIEADGRGGSTVEDAVENDAAGVPAEWERAGGHFVEDDAERKEVGTCVQFPAADLLGGHVGDGADGGAGAGEMLRVKGELCLGLVGEGGGGTESLWCRDVILARPKSRILAWPRLVTKILAGLMSRWTMP